MGREPWVYKIQCVGSQREREKKRGKKGKIGRGKDGGGKNSSGYFEVRYFRVRHRIKSSNQSSNTSPVQAAHICSIPFPSASFHSFFFLMRAHPRDQRKTRGKKKKSQRNPRTSRSRSKGVAESRCYPLKRYLLNCPNVRETF